MLDNHVRGSLDWPTELKLVVHESGGALSTGTLNIVMVAPKICGPSVWNLLNVTLLEHKVFLNFL